LITELTEDLKTKVFLEKAYKKYIELRDNFKLDKGVIDALLDAKAENDYLEFRAAKLAVALEKLKSLFMALPTTTTKEFIIIEADFNKLCPKLKKAISEILKDVGIDPKSREKIYGKIKELNRNSFAPLLEELCSQIGLKTKEKEIKLFINCRNKLVHKGEFYCIAATSDESAKCPPLESPIEEYYFMVSFLDRIFLKLLGYDGIYINHLSHKTGEDAREQL
jgi:hypothetical protein